MLIASDLSLLYVFNRFDNSVKARYATCIILYVCVQYIQNIIYQHFYAISYLCNIKLAFGRRLNGFWYCYALHKLRLVRIDKMTELNESTWKWEFIHFMQCTCSFYRYRYAPHDWDPSFCSSSIRSFNPHADAQHTAHSTHKRM